MKEVVLLGLLTFVHASHAQKPQDELDAAAAKIRRLAPRAFPQLPIDHGPAEPFLSAQQRKIHSKLNRALRQELVTMGKRDQKYRNQMMTLMKKGLKNPKTQNEFIEITAKQDRIDRENISRLSVMIREQGWPGISLVGGEASNAAFLILQHAELAEQKTYFPLLKGASEKHEASPADAAMLEDRILMREGKDQVYGTQLSTNKETGKLELWPVADEENVDSRRAAVGLPPMAEYLRFFGLKYAPGKKK